MAWEDVPAKLATYRIMQYSDDVQANRVIATYCGDPSAATEALRIAPIPVNLRADMEADLDYRMGACENLAKSRAINPKLLDK